MREVFRSILSRNEQKAPGPQPSQVLYNIYEDRERFALDAFAFVPGALRGPEGGIFRLEGPTHYMTVRFLANEIGEVQPKIVDASWISPHEQ